MLLNVAFATFPGPALFRTGFAALCFQVAHSYDRGGLSSFMASGSLALLTSDSF